MCLPDQIAIWKCWNENIGGRNALDLLYLKMSLRSSHLWGHDPQPTRFYETTHQRHTVSNKYESVFFIPWPQINCHINRGDFLLKIRGGPFHGPGPWGGPWTPVHVLYMSISSPTWMRCYSSVGYPQHWICWYPFNIHLSGERHCESKDALPKNTTSPARTQTQITQSLVGCTNIMPPCLPE